MTRGNIAKKEEEEEGTAFFRRLIATIEVGNLLWKGDCVGVNPFWFVISYKRPSSFYSILLSWLKDNLFYDEEPRKFTLHLVLVIDFF